MYRCILDVNSPYHVELPDCKEREKVRWLAEAFVSYDQSLPLAEQSPYTPELIALLAQCPPYRQGRQQGEAQRTIASESLKILDQQTKKVIEDIYYCLRARFLDTPSRLEAWGFNMKQTTRHILWPHTRAERLTLLSSYIEQELSRPEASRLTTPHLPDVIQLRDAIKAKQAIYKAGLTRRKQSNAIGYALAQQMTYALRAAGTFLISRRFNYTITRDLENWGYKVVKKSAQTVEEG